LASAEADADAVRRSEAMALEIEVRTGIIERHRVHDKDTGSAEVQIALLTARILEITGHLKDNMKDHAARRGLLKLVGRRASLLKYLARVDRARYQSIITTLGLRK